MEQGPQRRMRDPHLYGAILSRRSVRRYRKNPLDGETLARVHEIVSTVKPLFEGNRFQVLKRDVGRSEKLVEALGAYGTLVSPPHYLVPYLVGDSHPLEDCGYRSEQIAVRLAGLGVGSCFIGSLGREEAVLQRFGLPPGARIGAFLVFGWPTTNPVGRVVNAALRQMTGATRKLPSEKLFLLEDFNTPAPPPPHLAPLIEAGRNAPSAVDAQPWRFLWRRGRLHLLVKRHNRRYGRGVSQLYRLYDGGICMANLSLALQALGQAGHWRMHQDTDPDIADHPSDLQPLAVLIE